MILDSQAQILFSRSKAKPGAPARISELRQRLRDLGAKPCHEDRVLRGWSQVCSCDRKGSPAKTFFPAVLRNELPAIEAALDGLARLRGEYSANHGMDTANNDGSPDCFPTPALPRLAGEGADVARLLVELADGQMVESVLLPRGGLCVSTQVGCAVGCVFCMSGRDGLLRQLGSAEIVAQVVLARKRRAVSKVVFMGMGEPAHNLDNVLEAIQLLGTQGNIGHKNLVLSTVGDLRVFERLMSGFLPSPGNAFSTSISPGANPLPNPLPRAGEGANESGNFQFPRKREQAREATIDSGGIRSEPEWPSSSSSVKPALAVSLHTTDAALRARLLPRAPCIPVEELVERAEAYARATSYPTQYQWTLIEGVNDNDAEVERIAQLLSGKYAIMNFIPFNEVDGLDFRRPSVERTERMVTALHRQGILARVRDSAGQEVEGACGQLRARHLAQSDSDASGPLA